MAFYQNMPDRKKGKTNYGNTGSWDDEGTHYSGRGEGRGPRDRYEQKFNGRSAGKAFGERKNGYGEHKFDGRTGERSFGERKYDDRKPAGKSFGERKNGYGEHKFDGRTNESRPYGDRKFAPAGKPYGERKFDDRPERKPFGERKFNDRPERKSFGPKRFEDRNETLFETEEPRDHRDFEFRSPETMPQPYGEDRNENMLSGRNPIREALKNGRDIEKLLVQKGELSGSAREIVQMAKEARIVVQEVEKARLDELTPHHQGLIAFASAYQYSTVEEMLELAEAQEEEPFLILLDGVTDPHNLGAVIRSAECAGAHGVIVPERRSVGLTPAAVKASAGAIEHVKVARVVNLNRTIEDLKKKGIWVYAVTMDGKDYEKIDFKGGTALVIGAEGEGISRLTRDVCDCAVSLPMKGEINSLNASVAAGIMMYRVLSCRRK